MRRELSLALRLKFVSSILDGGLGIRSIRAINKAAMLKLSWDLISSKNQWACFLRARFFKNSSPVQYHLQSSIWPTIKQGFYVALENNSWQIGDRKQINFWRDKWLSQSVADMINLPQDLQNSLKSLVADCISAGSWNIPSVMQQNFLAIASKIKQSCISKFPLEDHVV